MKRVLYILLVLIVVVIAGAAAAPFLIPSSTIASLAADQVREATGRELVIEGDIERRVYPSLGITAGPVTLSNAEWASDPVMASIEKMVVDVKTSSLWSGGATEIERIELISPTVRLEIGPNGEENWTFSEAPGENGGGGGG
ncbi:MAG: AsmA family protein, partial [Rhodobacteraceae bacterium]|nr:AsmA family protein [Paracoccaceae bacterium]